MKYIIIPYIALGLVLSLTIGTAYTCVGDGASPKFYASPFVFKAKSLVSSMEYYYSIFGLLLNTIVWSIPLVLFRFVILRRIKKTNQNKIIDIVYKTCIIVLIAFSTLNMAIESVLIGNGFSQDSNYWFLNTDEKADEWGMKCKGELIFLER